VLATFPLRDKCQPVGCFIKERHTLRILPVLCYYFSVSVEQRKARSLKSTATPATVNSKCGAVFRKWSAAPVCY
jgi:hypothetical protein